MLLSIQPDLLDVSIMCELYASGVTRQKMTRDWLWPSTCSGTVGGAGKEESGGRRHNVNARAPFCVANTEEEKEEKTFHVTGE